MALSSQSGRPMSRNNYMSSRRRSKRGRWLLLTALVACAVAVGVWIFIDESPSDDTNTTNPTRTLAAKPSNDQATPGRVLDVTPETKPSETTTTKSDGPVELNREATIQKPLANIKTNTSAPVKETTQKPAPTPSGNTNASRDLNSAYDLAETEPVQARRLLTRAWRSNRLTDSERARAKALADTLTKIVLLDSRVLDGDPFSRRYTVQDGDALTRIVRNEDVNTEWTFVANINELRNANAIHPGQTLKLPRGTFHAEVSKPDYRLDLYQDVENERVLVGSYTVGLGEFGSTPRGTFRVRAASKLVNPEWIDPRTREQYDSDDPKNPIGERWIGIEGIEDHNRGLRGFGIHGTIEPDSIGKQRSMGCIRMLPDDVAMVYEVLTEPKSTIEIIGPGPTIAEPGDT